MVEGGEDTGTIFRASSGKENKIISKEEAGEFRSPMRDFDMSPMFLVYLLLDHPG